MSQLGFFPRRLEAEACRQFRLVYLLSEDVMQSENGPLEAVLTLGTNRIQEDVSSDGKKDSRAICYTTHPS